MKNYWILLFFVPVLSNFQATAQDMTPDQLTELITQVADTTMANGNSIQFSYKETLLICVYDENANRMRIISPVIKMEDLEEERELARRRTSGCVLIAGFVLFRLWIQAVANSDFGLLLLCHL